MNDRIGRIYFGVLGIVTLIFGIANLMVTIGGNDFSWGILEISGDMFRGGWGGLIVISAGLFYLSSLKNFSEIHQLSKALMGSILIWILAGTDIFVRVTESIPGGEEGPWFNSLDGFLSTYAPPYPPVIFLLPFSLVVIYYINKKKKA
ncbi:hypothetical protein KJ830_01340 [bacterium]|nr:hypothetical protein [bacterium]MBU4509668.1 hypothetical protein [bacterium]